MCARRPNAVQRRPQAAPQPKRSKAAKRKVAWPDSQQEEAAAAEASAGAKDARPSDDMFAPEEASAGAKGREAKRQRRELPTLG